MKTKRFLSIVLSMILILNFVNTTRRYANAIDFNEEETLVDCPKNFTVRNLNFLSRPKTSSGSVFSSVHILKKVKKSGSRQPCSYIPIVEGEIFTAFANSACASPFFISLVLFLRKKQILFFSFLIIITQHIKYL